MTVDGDKAIMVGIFAKTFSSGHDGPNYGDPAFRLIWIDYIKINAIVCAASIFNSKMT